MRLGSFSTKSWRAFPNCATLLGNQISSEEIERVGIDCSGKGDGWLEGGGRVRILESWGCAERIGEQSEEGRDVKIVTNRGLKGKGKHSGEETG